MGSTSKSEIKVGSQVRITMGGRHKGQVGEVVAETEYDSWRVKLPDGGELRVHASWLELVEPPAPKFAIGARVHITSGHSAGQVGRVVSHAGSGPFGYHVQLDGGFAVAFCTESELATEQEAQATAAAARMQELAAIESALTNARLPDETLAQTAARVMEERNRFGDELAARNQENLRLTAERDEASKAFDDLHAHHAATVDGPIQSMLVNDAREALAKLPAGEFKISNPARVIVELADNGVQELCACPDLDTALAIRNALAAVGGLCDAVAANRRVLDEPPAPALAPAPAHTCPVQIGHGLFARIEPSGNLSLESFGTHLLVQRADIPALLKLIGGGPVAAPSPSATEAPSDSIPFGPGVQPVWLNTLGCIAAWPSMPSIGTPAQDAEVFANLCHQLRREIEALRGPIDRESLARTIYNAQSAGTVNACPWDRRTTDGRKDYLRAADAVIDLVAQHVAAQAPELARRLEEAERQLKLLTAPAPVNDKDLSSTFIECGIGRYAPGLRAVADLVAARTRAESLAIIDRLSTGVANFSATIRVNSDMATEIVALEQRVKELVAANGDLAGRLAATESRIAELTRQRDALRRAVVDGANDYIDGLNDLEGAVNKIIAKAHQLESELGVANATIRDLRVNLAGTEGARKANGDLAERMREERDKHAAMRAENLRMAQEAIKQRDEARAKLADLEQKNQHLTARLSDVEASWQEGTGWPTPDAARRWRSDVQTELASAQQRAARAEQLRVEMRDAQMAAIAELQGKLTAAEQRAVELAVEVERLTTELKSWAGYSVEHVIAERKALHGEIDRVRAELATAEQHATRWAGILDALISDRADSDCTPEQVEWRRKVTAAVERNVGSPAQPSLPPAALIRDAMASAGALCSQRDGEKVRAYLAEHWPVTGPARPEACRCGHRCPDGARCLRCGGDPMVAGDSACVACDTSAPAPAAPTPDPRQQAQEAVGDFIYGHAKRLAGQHDEGWDWLDGEGQYWWASQVHDVLNNLCASLDDAGGPIVVDGRKLPAAAPAPAVAPAPIPAVTWREDAARGRRYVATLGDLTLFAWPTGEWQVCRGENVIAGDASRLDTAQLAAAACAAGITPAATAPTPASTTEHLICGADWSAQPIAAAAPTAPAPATAPRYKVVDITQAAAYNRAASFSSRDTAEKWCRELNEGSRTEDRLRWNIEPFCTAAIVDTWTAAAPEAPGS